MAEYIESNILDLRLPFNWEYIELSFPCLLLSINKTVFNITEGRYERTAHDSQRGPRSRPAGTLCSRAQGWRWHLCCRGEAHTLSKDESKGIVLLLIKSFLWARYTIRSRSRGEGPGPGPPGAYLFCWGRGLKNKAGPGPGKDPFIVYEFRLFLCIFSKFWSWNSTFQSRILKFWRASRVFL